MNKIIQFSLSNRLVVLALAAVLLIFGAYTAINLPVDVLPDLNRPRVTVFLEAEGMAPEEIEALVVYPAETALNGATDVLQVRSTSSIGLGLVYVEFDFGTDIYKARQIVTEKLQTIREQLPEGVTPKLGPISSVMGQIMLIGLTVDSTENMSPRTSIAELRTIADYDIRRRLLSIPGVAQVIAIGGDVLQYQVLVSMPKLNAVGLSVHHVEDALKRSNANTTGNFFEQGGTEILIRNIGRITSKEQIENIIIGKRDGIPVHLSQVAEVRFGAQFKRGDGGLNGGPAVILTVEKQPGASTIDLTEKVITALDEMRSSLPSDVRINTEIFRQSDFIRNAITNVEEALRDGAILVVIVLFLFLLNVRTTLITLLAIPMSLIITALFFKLFGFSINTMTLGGIAIAIGELVDDAIVDVENVFRRLRENRHSTNPKPNLRVVYEASSEIRNSIVYATVIVALVFIPLFALGGMEGRIFAPLGVAYITSILASLLVALTVTPVLCYYLLPAMRRMRTREDSFVVRWLKRQDTKLLRFGMNNPRRVLVPVALLFIGALMLLPTFGREFLPPFNEGSLTLNYSTLPGTSLSESNKVGSIIEKELLKVDGILFTGRRTGRAEMDEHSELPTNTDIEIAYDQSKRKKNDITSDIRERLSYIPGIAVNIGQPISHRIDHLLSGVRAQVAIKIFGTELAALRNSAQQVREVISKVEGVVDLQVERQELIPQLRIRPREDALRFYGLQRGEIAGDLEVFYQGRTATQILDNEKRFDVVLRLPDNERSDVESIGSALLETPGGELIPVKQVADIFLEPGPNTINHENTQRRIVISCNISGRDLGSAVKEIQQKVAEQVNLPQGYFVSYGGQFESQRSASRLILVLSLFSLAAIFLTLFTYFKSVSLVLQVMLSIPLALIGSIAAVWLTGGVFSVASLVGFITLTGIATRNGIMMLSHYIHLVEHEGEEFGRKMIIRGSLERLVPVMMTALTAIFALIPLVLAKDAPGKEILYPVAAVIIGGLISSTLLDMAVRPVVFQLFGRKALKKHLAAKSKQKP